MTVSIVIPTYKRPDYLNRLLESIARQTFQGFEVIVVDDNSPNREEYEHVISKFKSIFKEMHFVSNDANRGAPFSRNRGIRLAKYSLIALVDDDDEWLPEKLTRQVALFSNSPENVGIVYTWTDAIIEKGDVVHRYRGEIEGKALKEILRECFIPSPSVMVRKKSIEDAGLFDETLPSCQDWDMWTRILLAGYECRRV
ncbi:glycosyltransferase family 2 protein, partial [bacterium]|nr:glycosyltransferase family 2 protein [bacterium]